MANFAARASVAARSRRFAAATTWGAARPCTLSRLGARRDGRVVQPACGRCIGMGAQSWARHQCLIYRLSGLMGTGYLPWCSG
jgi:hypothetical protein